ncbi:MAG: hypothetical protein HY648_11600 [Acidobacteria bacterium]|nr:hypothetical protein [Acidobacteriota bacterium]
MSMLADGGGTFSYLASIVLHERKWVVRLRLNVHPDNFKASLAIAHAGTTGTAE